MQELLDSHKEKLLAQDLLELEKGHKEESKEVDVVPTLTAKQLEVTFNLINTSLAIVN